MVSRVIPWVSRIAPPSWLPGIPNDCLAGWIRRVGGDLPILDAVPLSMKMNLIQAIPSPPRVKLDEMGITQAAARIVGLIPAFIDDVIPFCMFRKVRVRGFAQSKADW